MRLAPRPRTPGPHGEAREGRGPAFHASLRGPVGGYRGSGSRVGCRCRSCSSPPSPRSVGPVARDEVLRRRRATARPSPTSARCGTEHSSARSGSETVRSPTSRMTSPSRPSSVHTKARWWTQGDSNPRPHGCQPCALPTELWALREGSLANGAARAGHEELAIPSSCQACRGASRQSRSRS